MAMPMHFKTTKNSYIVYSRFFRTHIHEINGYEEIYFAEQPSLGTKIKTTVFAYIDIKRVDEINITRGTWNVDFELEVNSPFSDPENIYFSNRSLKNMASGL